MPRGSLCISIDVELAWGIWDKPSLDYHARCAESEERIVRDPRRTARGSGTRRS